MQLSYHLYFFMMLVETIEARAITIEKKVIDVEKELGEVETRATKAKRTFREQKKCTDDLLKNIIHLATKLREAGIHLTSMRQRLEAASAGEV